MSRPALKRLGAAIDFAQDELSPFRGASRVPLQVNAAGQYILDVMQFDRPTTDVSMVEVAPESTDSHEHVTEAVVPAAPLCTAEHPSVTAEVSGNEQNSHAINRRVVIQWSNAQ